MSILLTDEEQRGIVGRHYEVQRDIGQPALAMVIADLIAKAQVKKLVGYIESKYSLELNGHIYINILTGDWEAIKKEVEDG